MGKPTIYIKCEHCKGRGIATDSIWEGFRLTTSAYSCPDCKGSGRGDLDRFALCPRCKGHGDYPCDRFGGRHSCKDCNRTGRIIPPDTDERYAQAEKALEALDL